MARAAAASAAGSAFASTTIDARAGLAIRRPCAYLAGMSFWRQISPRGAVGDFVHEWQRPNPYRWRVLGVSVAATFTLMVIVIPDTERAEPRPPVVTWISTFE